MPVFDRRSVSAGLTQLQSSRSARFGTRELKAVHFDGQVSDVRISLGAPRRLAREGWLVTVAIEGLLEASEEVTGVDQDAALTLARDFVVQILQYFVAGGGYFTASTGSVPVDLEQLFAVMN